MLVDAALSIGKTCRTESMVVGKGIKLLPSLKEVNLDNVIEVDDHTDLSGELACAGGACEIV